VRSAQLRLNWIGTLNKVRGTAGRQQWSYPVCSLLQLSCNEDIIFMLSSSATILPVLLGGVNVCKCHMWLTCGCEVS
jgi:hypothetical protein